MDQSNLKNKVISIADKFSGYLRVKVSPNANKARILEVQADEHNTIKIAIQSAPERGKANQELVKFIQKIFPHKQISIISGEHSQLKLIRIS